MLSVFLISFAIAFLGYFPFIKYFKKKKIGQSILEYVDFHDKKQGTPTMGGLVFLIVLLLIAVFVYDKNSFLMGMTVVVTLGFGLIGFLDDYLKIKYKRNLGLTPLQKIFGQCGLALIVSLFCFYSPLVPKSVILPFTFQEIEIGFWIVPIVFFLFVGVVNAVNLTDGIDGLAGSVSCVNIASFAVLILIYSNYIYNLGYSATEIGELNMLATISLAFVGAILAFLVFNSNKASVFMGDVGSLSIGAFITSISVFSGLYLYLPFICVLFALTTLSVIIQVAYFKLKKKRVFLMAPFHHHLEKKGYSEAKIVFSYSIISIIASTLIIYFTIC